MPFLSLVILLFFPIAAAAQTPPDQQPFECNWCEHWNQPRAPFQLSENSWYVGTRGLASVLIVDSGELALIDGALPQSAEQIIENIESLGFNPQNIDWILNSHAHYDHAGGIAALARITGARVAAGERGVIALTEGPYHPEDPQARFGESARYPSVEKVHPVNDGDVITVGTLEITAVASPGHAPGGMSWTWKSCNEDSKCLDVVFLDSLNAVSADGYRFTNHPQTLAEMEASIKRIGKLPCDIAIAAHPDQVPEPEADQTVCAAYAEAARKRLDRRLSMEE